MADVEGSVPQPRERQRPQAEGGAGDCRAGSAAPGSTTAGSAGRPAAAGSRSASACGPSLPVKPLFQLRVHRGPHATAALWARAALLTGLYHGTGMGRAKAQASQKDGALRVTQQAVEPWSCRTSWL